MNNLIPLLAVVVLAVATALTCGQIAAKDPTAPPSAAILIPRAKVDTGFAKGMPLLENSDFKIHTARRDAPGIAEIHARDTDIFYVLDGSATFVTGGVAVEPKTIAPDEIRGKELTGGEAHHLAKGDIIIIPKGVPHWFKEVNGVLLYYVVKVTSK